MKWCLVYCGCRKSRLVQPLVCRTYVLISLGTVGLCGVAASEASAKPQAARVA